MALSQKQLSERKNFIGSSEAKIIADGSFSDWEKLISEKKGEQERLFTKQERFRMDTGSFMEPYVLNAFEEELKLKAKQRNSGRTVDYQGVPIHSTYDAIASDGLVVEAKTHWRFWNMEEICTLYEAQCQHHIHTSAKDHCWLFVFFGVNCRYEYRKIQRDDAWIEMYLDQCKQFWHWYTKGITPDGFQTLPPVDWEDKITLNMRDLECWDSKMQSQMNVNAQDIIEASKASKSADLAKTEIKHYMPDNAKKMVLDLSGNLEGDKIIVSRSKTNKLTLTHQLKKEKRDGN